MSGFDKLAKPYHWMEYLSFGRALERCRFHFLPQLHEAQQALVLGDGDGRFTARFLQSAPHVRVHALDGSVSMLRQLTRRCEHYGVADRVVTVQADLTRPLPQVARLHRYDLVATHFFLDCLAEPQVNDLLQQVTPLLQPGARWVVSEFAIARGRLRGPSRLLVSLLYFAFRMLTGLRTRSLPDHGSLLQQHGFVLLQRVPRLGGLLIAESWRYQPN